MPDKTCPKTCTVADIVARIDSGMTVGIGGWGARRKPMAVVRELVRSSVTDLTLVSFGGADVGFLAAAGKLRKLIFGFVSLDFMPLDPHFRAARQKGVLEAQELDEGMLYLGLRAAAMRLPFLPTRAGLFSDVLRVNPHIKTIRSPYKDGEIFVAMPAINLDVAVIHVHEADCYGAVRILGADPYFDEWLCRAAKKVYVTCEDLCDGLRFDDDAQLRLHPFERALVSGVAHVPWGAHPSSCAPNYGWDVENFKLYAKDLDSYQRRFVALEDMSAYVEAVGGEAHIRGLPMPVL